MSIKDKRITLTYEDRETLVCLLRAEIKNERIDEIDFTWCDEKETVKHFFEMRDTYKSKLKKLKDMLFKL